MINGKEVQNPLLRFLLAITAIVLAAVVLGGAIALILGILGIVLTFTVGLLLFVAAILVGLIPLVFLVTLFRKR
jgi:hypothetical protein